MKTLSITLYVCLLVSVSLVVGQQGPPGGRRPSTQRDRSGIPRQGAREQGQDRGQGRGQGQGQGQGNGQGQGQGQGPRPTEAPPPEATTEDTSGRLLSLPNPEKCAKRPSHFKHGEHNYFYSDRLDEHKGKKYDWLQGRNECREYCMDLVSIETPSEDNMINEFIEKEDLPYIWTSGRLCNFKGCDREDLQPVAVNGWFWSGSGVKMAPTNDKPPGWTYQPWSFTGHKTALEGHNIAQPDNAEFDINESVEACMGILNDIYQDGVKWHDIACYHTKPFLCEDSDQLLEYARATNPDMNIF